MTTIAKKIEAIMFPVSKIETTEILPLGFVTTSQNSHAIVGEINGIKRLINVCSNRYELVPNNQVFTPIIERLESEGIEYEISVDHRDFRKFYLDINFKKHALTVGKNNDIIFPKVRITHSYDGTLKYGFNFGWFRLVCSNGLSVPYADSKHENLNVTGKHTAGIRENLSLFFSKLDFFLTNAGLIKKSFEQLTDRAISNPADRIEEVLRATKFITKSEMTIRDKSLIDYVINVGKQEQAALDIPFTDWLVYNGINRLINDDSLNSLHPEFRDKEDSKVLEFLLQ